MKANGLYMGNVLSRQQSHNNEFQQQMLPIRIKSDVY